MPFPTALLGAYPRQRIAVVCYGAVMAMAGVSFSAMRFYAFYIGKLNVPGIGADLLKRAMAKSAMNPALHILAIALAWVTTTASLALYVAIPLLFFLPTKLERLSVVKGEECT